MHQIVLIRHAGLNKFQARLAEDQRIVKKIAPDPSRGSQVGKRPAESFDHEPSIIIDLFERGESGFPVDLTGTGSSPIVLADVDVRQSPPDCLNGRGRFSSIWA